MTVTYVVGLALLAGFLFALSRYNVRGFDARTDRLEEVVRRHGWSIEPVRGGLFKTSISIEASVGRGGWEAVATSDLDPESIGATAVRVFGVQCRTVLPMVSHTSKGLKVQRGLGGASEEVLRAAFSAEGIEQVKGLALRRRRAGARSLEFVVDDSMLSADHVVGTLRAIGRIVDALADANLIVRHR